MGKPKGAAAASLRLFPAEPMTSERAWTIVDRLPLDSPITSERRRCRDACCRKRGAKGHGPYWFAVVLIKGKRRLRYIGSDAKLAEVREAWAIVGAEVDAAQAVAAAVEPPEAVRARQLTARARARARVPRTVTVPIVEVRPKSATPRRWVAGASGFAAVYRARGERPRDSQSRTNRSGGPVHSRTGHLSSRARSTRGRLGATGHAARRRRAPARPLSRCRARGRCELWGLVVPKLPNRTTRRRPTSPRRSA